MEHRDAQLSDITIVLKRIFAEEKLQETVDALSKHGMLIDEVNADNGVVEGTIDSAKLVEIRTWDCVEYVRVEFSYIADYPPNDPRNLDPVEDGAEDSED